MLPMHANTQPNTKQYMAAICLVIDQSIDTQAKKNNNQKNETKIHMNSKGKPPVVRGR